MNRLLLVVVCIANSVVGNAAQVGAVDDNADNCDCQCEAVDKPCRCVCDIKNGGEPFYQNPPQDVIDGWNREKGNFFLRGVRRRRGRLPDVSAARRGRVPRLPLLICCCPVIIIIKSSALRGPIV